ncbi:MAG: malonyl-ACP O-methyltransferase BioC [Gammaproteobacteria bacterium]
MAIDEQSGLPELQQARRSFTRAAHSYDEPAVLQQEVQRRTLQKLDPIRIAPHRVLDLGCGTGLGVVQLAKRFTRARVIGGDFAEQMVRLARRRRRWWQRKPYLVMDAHRLPLVDNSVDLVYSSLTLQWSLDLDQVLRECRRVLKPGGLILFSSLGPDTLYEMRQASSEVDGNSRVNGFFDMHDVGDAMVRAGFESPVLDVDKITMTYSSLRDLARDIKAIGAHNVTRGRLRGVTSRRRWQRLEQAYEQFRREGRLPATYEVFYAHGWVREPVSLAEGKGLLDIPAGRRDDQVVEAPIKWHRRNK